jgi:cytochrome b561
MEFGRRNIPQHMNSPLASTLPMPALSDSALPANHRGARDCDAEHKSAPPQGLGADPATTTSCTIIDDARRYGTIDQLFHWVTAVLIGLQLTLGLLAAHMRLGPAKLAMVTRHKSVGMAVLVLAIARLAWRFIHAPPPLPFSIDKLERRMASGAHAALYGLLLVLPTTGWLLSSGAKRTINVLGIISLPSFVAPHPELLAQLRNLHELFALALASIALLHIAAALRHHFWLKDGVLIRMLPRRRGGAPAIRSAAWGINRDRAGCARS